MRGALVVLGLVAVVGFAAAGCGRPQSRRSVPRLHLFKLAGDDAARDTLAKVGEGPVPVTVMTRNLYLGADLDPVLAAVLGDPESVPAAVGEAWAGVRATDFHARAELLAGEIEAKDPALVGLQEVVLWRLQTPADSMTERPRPAKAVEYDFLKILLRALRDRGLRYRAVAVATNIDVEFPGLVGEGLADIRYTDRDVILARRGVATSRPASGTFETQLVFPYGEDGLSLRRSWTAVDAKVDGRRLRFVNTHLEDGYESIQREQLAEILAGPAATPLPVVLVGDFNSDGANGHAPAVHGDVLAAGLVDSWTEFSSDPGLTWGHGPRLDGPAAAFTVRLDYVFHSAGISAGGGDIVGEEPGDRVGGLWPSDHAGVVVDLLLP